MTRLRTIAAPAPRAVTLPSCPACGEPLRRERVRGNHDRPAVRFLACRCGHQEGHEVEREGGRAGMWNGSDLAEQRRLFAGVPTAATGHQLP